MLVSVDYAGTYVNENQDTVTLTKKSGGTYDLIVTQSTWERLPAQSEITGFKKQ